ncbi:MAG: hypothetical protein KKD63_11055 [Proteobacteria bacterium]|nr:hypothetical protein [Desulfobulbaceae bacterium]MBU4153409.1 hypothetical protein [Pseudomonadota bacterium]
MTALKWIDKTGPTYWIPQRNSWINDTWTSNRDNLTDLYFSWNYPSLPYETASGVRIVFDVVESRVDPHGGSANWLEMKMQCGPVVNGNIPVTQTYYYAYNSADLQLPYPFPLGEYTWDIKYDLVWENGGWVHNQMPPNGIKRLVLSIDTDIIIRIKKILFAVPDAEFWTNYRGQSEQV